MKTSFALFLFMLLLSCNQASLTITVGSSSSILPATKLIISGDSSAEFSTCSSAIIVTRADVNNNPSSAATPLTVTLGGMGTGTFHLLNDCSDLATTTVDILAGNASATVYYTNANVGANTFTADGGTLTQDTHSFTVNNGPPTVIVKVSGDAQTGVVGTTLTNPLVVRVDDAGGNPVAGVALTFTVTAGGGSRTIIDATTDSNGEASATWTIGTGAGAAQTLEVTEASLPTISFSATASADAASAFAMSGPATVAAGICSTAITITRQDQYGNDASPASVTAVTLGGHGSDGGYYTAADCSGVATTSVNIASGDTDIDVYYLSNTAANYTLTADSTGFTQGDHDIEVTGLASVITLSRNFYSLYEDGATIGSTITISRTVTTISHSVTLAVDAITANSSDLTFDSRRVLFAPGEATKTFNAADFTVVDDTDIEGDETFRLKLSAITNGATFGATSEAQINIIDNDAPGNFFFAENFYSANENGGTLTGTIQRAGSTAAAADVNVTFRNGTAIGVTDFDNTPVNVSFGIGEDEKTFSVPIVNTAVAGDNKSFYMELTGPSVGTTARGWSLAKARILDEDDATVCDNTNTNLAVNAGFGGGAGSQVDPYRICSLSQMYLVRNNLASHFRVMADIDLDPSLDADPLTAGVQAYGPITGTFTGTFNGDERILKNFRHSQSIASADPVALFNVVGGNVTVLINGVNIIQGYNFPTIDDVNTGGIVGKITSTINTLSNNSYSGYVFSRGTALGTDGTAGGILNRSEGTPSSALIRNFASGSVVSQKGAGGIVAGHFMALTTNIDYAYSVMNVSGEGSLGGISGWIYNLSNATHRISNSHAKGVIRASNSGAAGGIAGQFYAGSLTDITISDSTSSAYVIGNAQVGGIVGHLWCKNSAICALNNITSTATIDAIGTTSGGGGIVGAINFIQDITITNVGYNGIITSSLSNFARLGGIIGIVSNPASGASSVTLTLTNVNSGGTITSIAPNYPMSIGGIIGEVSLNGGDLNTITISSATSSMVLGPLGHTIGGLIGRIQDDAATGGHTINISNSSATGDVSGFTSISGLIGYVDYSSALNAALTISNTFSTGNVTATGDSNGGLVGDISTSTNSDVTITDSYSTSNITSSSSANGGLVGEISVSGGIGSRVIISDSYATGDIIGAANSGGLIGVYDCGSMAGLKELWVLRSRASGNVTTTGSSGAGGLIGALGTTTATPSTDCHVLVQDTYSDNPSVTGINYVAGLIGRTIVPVGTTTNYVIEDSYSIAPVSGTSGNITGLINYNPVEVVVTNSFWMLDVGHNDVGVTTDGMERDMATMQTAATYPWDTLVWNLADGFYPIFQP